MRTRIMEAILRLAASPQDTEGVAGAAACIRAVSEEEWHTTIATLNLHSVVPLAWYAVKAHGLSDALPPEARKRLQEAHRNTLMHNMALFHAWGQVLDGLRDAGVEPVFFKGVVLAAVFYPDMAMRPMEDIDMAIEPGDTATVDHVFASLGYKVASTMDDAVDYANGAGVAFDVHHRQRLFESWDKAAITTTVPCGPLQNREMKIHTNEAIAAHLAYHAQGHRDSRGYVLRWIVDLHFLMQHCAERLSIDQVKRLLPTSSAALLFLRFMRFLDAYMGTPIPSAIRPHLSTVSPLTLDEVLRSRRLALWGLPSLRGFGRLALGRNKTPAGDLRPFPKPADLLLWPADLFRQRMARLPQAWTDHTLDTTQVDK